MAYASIPNKQQLAYAYLMTVPVMFTLCSSITFPLSASIRKKNNQLDKRKVGLLSNQEHLYFESENSIRKKKMLGRWSSASCREAAVTVSAAH